MNPYNNIEVGQIKMNPYNNIEVGQMNESI